MERREGRDGGRSKARLLETIMMKCMYMYVISPHPTSNTAVYMYM
jgi:hypothetical protein